MCLLTLNIQGVAQHRYAWCEALEAICNSIAHYKNTTAYRKVHQQDQAEKVKKECEKIINTRKNTLNCMSHKTLTISEEAYQALAELKKEGESFTELIKRITQPIGKKKLHDFVGVMAGEEFDDFEKAALEVRHSLGSRLKRLKL